MAIRAATHAGSWYSDDAQTLNDQLSVWLTKVPSASILEDGTLFEPPMQTCKAIIAPHAGYAYSGPAAAWAYKTINTIGIRRVFLLGPSHHVYLDGCALSACPEYATPIGNLPLDRAVIDELSATGKFTLMDIQTDEDEHSMEMHLPYIRKIFEGKDIAIVPILIGAISATKEDTYGKLLSPYLLREDTIFIVSSDFCHWGTRFSYTRYYPSGIGGDAIRLDRKNTSQISKDHPIYRSISDLDHEGMEILAKISATSTVHQDFGKYLARTGNTICGRHPIGVLVAAIESLVDRTKSELKWVRYEQSSPCEGIKDSSVSYASAYVVV